MVWGGDVHTGTSTLIVVRAHAIWMGPGKVAANKQKMPHHAAGCLGAYLWRSTGKP